MFPLLSKTFPPDAEALRAALEESLRRVVRPAGPIVAVEEKSYPHLAAIRVSLDGANAGESPPPRPSPPVGNLEPRLRVDHFEISGQPILVQQAKVNLICRAHDVQLSEGRDRDGNALLLLQDAAQGAVEIAIATADLESLVLSGAQAAAAQQGVSVQKVRIELHARTERALDLVMHVRAKKLFLGATVRLSGSVEIDEKLNARLSGLECVGDGTLGTLACGFLAPHLQRFDGREFSLMTLPLGDVKLRQIRIATGNELRVTAEFGRPA